MSKTARMVMKIIGASLAFAAFVCLLIGGWHDLSVGCCGMKKRLCQKFALFHRLHAASIPHML